MQKDASTHYAVEMTKKGKLKTKKIDVYIMERAAS